MSSKILKEHAIRSINNALEALYNKDQLKEIKPVGSNIKEKEITFLIENFVNKSKVELEHMKTEIESNLISGHRVGMGRAIMDSFERNNLTRLLLSAQNSYDKLYQGLIKTSSKENGHKI